MSLYDHRMGIKGKFVKETAGYREADVQVAIRETLKDNQKHCDKHDEGYEEFERGYKIAINHCRVNILHHFGDALHALDAKGRKDE